MQSRERTTGWWRGGWWQWCYICSVTKSALWSVNPCTCIPHYTRTPVDCKINDRADKWLYRLWSEGLLIDSRNVAHLCSAWFYPVFPAKLLWPLVPVVAVVVRIDTIIDIITEFAAQTESIGTVSYVLAWNRGSGGPLLVHEVHEGSCVWWLRLLAAGLSQRIAGCVPRPVLVTCVADRVELE